MKIRLVFARKDDSIISRAICWFSQRKSEPERRCSHVMVKFQPGGVYEQDWACFEAMERGVWASPYDVALGKQTVVAEFEALVSDDAAYKAMRVALNRYLSWYYDFYGIGLWAVWILAKRWFWTPLHWLGVTFRPGKASKALFCSGLALQVVKLMEQMDPFADLGMKALTARTSTPQNEIDICFDHPKGWKKIKKEERLQEALSVKP